MRIECRAEILLLKNKLRLTKGIIRHIWPGLIGYLVVGGIFLYQFLLNATKDGFGTAVAPGGLCYALLLIAGINLFRVFFTDTPVFRIEAASILHAYNTGYFRKSLLRIQLLSVIFSSLISGALACVLNGFLFNSVFLKWWLILMFYISSCTFLSWIFYHARGIEKWAVCIAFPICTALLFFQSTFSTGVLAAVLCAAWIYVRRFLRLNVPKYFERLRFLEAANAALSRNDMAGMQQMAEENRASHVRGPMLFQFRPTNRTALWIKSLLEILRIQKQMAVVLALFLMAGWFVSQTTVLASVPLLDEPRITRALAAFCSAAAFNGVHQILIRQAKTVSDKRGLGLSLPYSIKYIIVSYGISAMILNLLLAFVLGLLYFAPSIRFVPLLLTEAAAYFISCCAQLYEIKFQRGVVMLANAFLLAGVYYFLAI